MLYFDNLLLKTPDLCNLRTFVAIFFVAIYALFPPIFGGKKTDSANLSAFRMYASSLSSLGLDLDDKKAYILKVDKLAESVFWPPKIGGKSA